MLNDLAFWSGQSFVSCFVLSVSKEHEQLFISQQPDQRASVMMCNVTPIHAIAVSKYKSDWTFYVLWSRKHCFLSFGQHQCTAKMLNMTKNQQWKIYSDPLLKHQYNTLLQVLLSESEVKTQKQNVAPKVEVLLQKNTLSEWCVYAWQNCSMWATLYCCLLNWSRCSLSLRFFV